MLLIGFTGRFSSATRPSSAGAYTEAVLTTHGPSCRRWRRRLLAGVGVVVGLPALRVKGMYLAIADAGLRLHRRGGFARWEGVTGGNAGKR